MASTSGRRVVEALTNKSGGSVIAGDVVVIDSGNNEAFTTSTAGGVTGLVGVAQESIANNAVGRILTAGYAALVNVNASVTRGNYGKTHTVAKQATDMGSSRGAGAFCQFLTGGTTPTAHLFGLTDASTSSSGVPAGTSFPGSPATNDLYFRTDRGLLYQYNGTRWLCICPHFMPVAMQRAVNPVTANGFAEGVTPVIYGGYDFWGETFALSLQVQVTNDGTKYWTIKVDSYDGTTPTTLGTVTTQSLAPDTNHPRSVAINALVGTASDSLTVAFTKTSTPGNLIYAAGIWGRFVG
jgi:hypothetical protein